jgi:AcrR family transcriptional regulator
VARPRNTSPSERARARYRIAPNENPLTASNPADALDPRTQKTRAALCSAMLSLLQEKAFEEITIRAVTKRAKISYPTFFGHYESIRGVLRDLIENQIRQMIALTVPAIRRTTGHTAALALCTFVDQHRTLWTALLTGGAAGIVRAEFARQARQVNTTLTRRHWLPVELANILAVSAIVDILTWWLQGNPRVSVEEVVQTLDRLVGSSFVRGRTLARKTQHRSRDDGRVAETVTLQSD